MGNTLRVVCRTRVGSKRRACEPGKSNCLLYYPLLYKAKILLRPQYASSIYMHSWKGNTAVPGRVIHQSVSRRRNLSRSEKVENKQGIISTQPHRSCDKILRLFVAEQGIGSQHIFLLLFLASLAARPPFQKHLF